MAALAMFIAVGCGGGTAPPATPAATSQAKDAAPAASGPQQRWKDTLAAAKREGTVTVYGELQPALRDALTSTFQSKYGIRIDFVMGRSAELATRWDRERSAGIDQVDIFHMGGVTSTLIMKPKGAFGPIEPNLILPEVLDSRAWQDGKIRYLDKDKTIVPLNRSWTSYVGVNTDMVKEGQLKSYKDILNPEWKDKVAMFDPGSPGAGSGWASLMLTDAFGPEGGRQYMRQLAATKPAITRDNRQIVEWVARGKYAIGIGMQYALAGEFKQMGAPITMNRFVEGGNIVPGSGCVEISARPSHPNAAIVYLNWLLTPEGQLTFNKPTGNPPIRLDVPLEGFDPINVARPSDRAFLADEVFFQTQGEAMSAAREIFGSLLR